MPIKFLLLSLIISSYISCPDNRAATRVRLRANGCYIVLQGDNNKFDDGLNFIIFPTVIDLKTEYHGCVGHSGTIIIPVA